MNTFRQVRSVAIIAAGLAGALALQSGVAAAQDAGPEPLELGWTFEEQPDALLARKVIESAGAYQLHLARSGQGQVMRASNMQSEQLARGATALAAMTAVKDPEFAASVRWLASDPMARKRIAARVLQNPAYAARFDPTGATTARVTETLKADAADGVVARGLAIAALAVLGEAGDANASAVESLLSEPCGAGECVYAAR